MLNECSAPEVFDARSSFRFSFDRIPSFPTVHSVVTACSRILLRLGTLFGRFIGGVYGGAAGMALKTMPAFCKRSGPGMSERIMQLSSS